MSEWSGGAVHQRLQQCLRNIDAELESAFEQSPTDDDDDDEQSLFSLSSSNGGVEGDVEPSEGAANETAT